MKLSQNSFIPAYYYYRGFRGGFDRGFETIPSLIHENLSLFLLILIEKSKKKWLSLL